MSIRPRNSLRPIPRHAPYGFHLSHPSNTPCFSSVWLLATAITQVHSRPIVLSTIPYVLFSVLSVPCFQPKLRISEEHWSYPSCGSRKGVLRTAAAGRVPPGNVALRVGNYKCSSPHFAHLTYKELCRWLANTGWKSSPVPLRRRRSLLWSSRTIPDLDRSSPAQEGGIANTLAFATASHGKNAVRELYY